MQPVAPTRREAGGRAYRSSQSRCHMVTVFCPGSVVSSHSVRQSQPVKRISPRPAAHSPEGATEGTRRLAGHATRDPGRPQRRRQRAPVIFHESACTTVSCSRQYSNSNGCGAVRAPVSPPPQRPCASAPRAGPGRPCRPAAKTHGVGRRLPVMRKDDHLPPERRRDLSFSSQGVVPARFHPCAHGRGRTDAP